MHLPGIRPAAARYHPNRGPPFTRALKGALLGNTKNDLQSVV